MERMCMFDASDIKSSLEADKLEFFNLNITTPVDSIIDLEIWDIEELIDKTNPKMLNLINYSTGVDFSNDYYTRGYIDGLPLLEHNRINNAVDIYRELISVARTRLMNMLINYYGCVRAIKLYSNGVKIEFYFNKGKHFENYTLILNNNGDSSLLNGTIRKVTQYKNWKELVTSHKVNSIDEDFMIILKKIDWMWTYTIDRLKVKAYILALNNLTVKTYKDYLRQ